MGIPQKYKPATKQQVANTFLEHIANGDLLAVLEFATVLGWQGEHDTAFSQQNVQSEYLGAIRFAADMLTLPFTG